MVEKLDEGRSKTFINNWDYNEKSLLVKRCGNYWKFLMRLLNVEEEVIENICARYAASDIKDQAVLVLEDILNSRRGYLTWKEIESALLILKRNDLIIAMKEHIPVLIDCKLSEEEKSIFYSSICESNPFAIIALELAPYWKLIIDKLQINDINREGMKHTLKEDNAGYPEEEKAYQCLIKLNNKCTNGICIKQIQDIIIKEKNITIESRQRILEKLQDIFPTDQESLEKDEQDHNIQLEWGFVALTHSTEHELECLHDVEEFDAKYNQSMKMMIQIPRGGGNQKCMKILQFCETESVDYVKKYFGKSDYFCFNYDCESNDSMAEVLSDFLKEKRPGFMIKDYDLMKHFEFLKLQKYISDDHFSRFKSSHNMDFIGVEGVNRAMYFIKKSSASKLEELMQDIKDSSAYVRAFTLLHKHNLVDRISCLVPLVVIPTTSEHLINEVNEICGMCSEFVITEEKFLQADELETLLSNLVVKSVSSNAWENLTQYDFNNFRYEVASIFCFMSTQDTDLMPCLSDDVSEQIENGKLLFSPRQLELSNLKDKRIILIGSYGTGKTLVAKSVAKKLSFNLEKSDSLHYINFGTSSDLTADMDKFVESLSKKDQVVCKSSGDGMDVGSFKRGAKIHLICDEVSLSEWSKTDLLTFIKLLAEPQFVNSHCIIICQPMVKKRSFTQDGIHFDHSFSEQIQFLCDTCFFKEKKLEETFRNPNKVEKLAKYTKGILENHKNRFSDDILKQRSVENESERREKSPSKSSLYSPDNEANNSEDNCLPNQRGIANQKAGNNLDVKLKYIKHNHQKNNHRNKVFLESSFTYFDGKSMLDIDGPDPLLYFPSESKEECEDFENICLISGCFKNIIQVKKIKKFTVIHFEDATPLVLEYALDYLKRNEKIDFQNISIKSVFETKGMEYDNVIIYLSVNEYHLRHYLVEAITRCKCKLIFVVVKENWEISKSDLLWKMIENWEATGLVRKVPTVKAEFDNINVNREKYKKQYSFKRKAEENINYAQSIKRFCFSLQTNVNKEESNASGNGGVANNGISGGDGGKGASGGGSGGQEDSCASGESDVMTNLRKLINRMGKSLNPFKNSALENAYDYFGLDSTATNNEINTAYRKKCVETHPDMVGSPKDFYEAQVMMQIIKVSRGDYKF